VNSIVISYDCGWNQPDSRQMRCNNVTRDVKSSIWKKIGQEKMKICKKKLSGPAVNFTNILRAAIFLQKYCFSVLTFCTCIFEKLCCNFTRADKYNPCLIVRSVHTSAGISTHTRIGEIDHRWAVPLARVYPNFDSCSCCFDREGRTR